MCSLRDVCIASMYVCLPSASRQMCPSHLCPSIWLPLVYMSFSCYFSPFSQSLIMHVYVHVCVLVCYCNRMMLSVCCLPTVLLCRIKGWWLAHHYISTGVSALLLTWYGILWQRPCCTFYLFAVSSHNFCCFTSSSA